MRQALTALFAAAGTLLVVAGAALAPSWFALHMALLWWPPLPSSLLPWVKAGLVLAGLGVAAAGWLLGRWIGRQPEQERWGALGRVVLAAVLALVVVEGGMHLAGWREAPWRAGRLELRLGGPDARYGWAPRPARTTNVRSGANVTRYAIDPWGDRAQRETTAPDPERPSVVVAGESIAFGLGVPWDQTFPAILGEDLGLQVVDTGYPGYGADQVWLRLEDALGRLRRPEVVVVTFVPAMLLRDVQDFRPRLALRDGALATVPPAAGLLSALRLRDFLVNELPLLSEARLERSLQLTGALLSACARAAEARQARPVFLVVSLGPPRPFAAHPEAPLLRRLFVEQRLPFVLVDVAPSELVLSHPDAAAHRRIAEAIEACVRQGACTRAPEAPIP